MYYKVIFDDKVIDVLDNLVYLKYQTKYNRMILCKESEAQAIFSSDRSEIWHVDGFYDIPVEGYDTVRLEKIDKYEYKRFKVFTADTPETVVDRFVKLVLVDKEVSQLAESLKRLYERQEIDASTVIELCSNFEITEDKIKTILEEVKEVE